MPHGMHTHTEETQFDLVPGRVGYLMVCADTRKKTLFDLGPGRVGYLMVSITDSQA